MPSESCDRIRVERYFLEEGGVEERERTGRHLETCGRCREHLDALARDRDAYLSLHPYSAFAARHSASRSVGAVSAPSRSSARLRSRPRSPWLPALAGGLAVVALVAVLRGPGLGLQGGSAHSPDPSQDQTQDPGGVTYKGGESLEFHYRRDGKVQEGRLDEEYRAGDELQFLYAAGKLSHVTLLSVDASGTVSLYRAHGAVPASLPAKAGKLEPFPFGVTLDAAPGGELFVAVFSQGPVDDAALETWLSEAYRVAVASAGTNGGVGGAGGAGGHGVDGVDGAATGPTGPIDPTGPLPALEKALRPPAVASSGVLKTLMLRKAAP